MNRERLAWFLSFILLAAVAFRNPSAAQRDSDYRFVRTLVDIQRLVVGNYVEKVEPGKMEQAAIDGMLNQLDPHTTYIPPAKREEFDRLLEGTFKGVGVQLNQLAPNGPIEVVTPIEGSPAAKAGVMPGDVILKVNGQSIEGMQLRDVIRRIGGEADTQVTLTLKRETGEVVEKTMRRQEIVLPTVKGHQRREDNTWDYFVLESPRIAYVRITQFTPSTHDAFRAVMSALIANRMEGLILDLRWNPGGQLDQAVAIVDLFVSKGVIVTVKGDKRPEDVKRAREEGTLPPFPMVVLVNEHSASAAEVVAGSLLDNRRATIVGERTFGKGSVQEVIPLEGNNGELKLTTAYYYLPSGKLVHRKKGAETWGVEPQIPVAMSEEAEKRVVEAHLGQDRFRRPGNGNGNGGGAATAPATLPTTQPIDAQLQRAIDTLVLAIHQRDPATAPATVPADPSTRNAEDHE